MTELTDPALELADLCDRLNVQSGAQGDVFLSNSFDVEPWSAEFLQMIYTIVNRTAALQRILETMRARPAVISGATAHLHQIRHAFSKQALGNPWSNVGARLVGPEHSSPIRMLSAGLPEEYSYPRLTEAEAQELKDLVAKLLSWLRRLQLSERDFIRESLIEGLEQFQFRLERLQWFGWGYSIQSLREVILAYLTLERGIDPQANPDAAAVLKRLAVLFRRIAKYASVGKDAVETTDWVISCYNATVRAAAGPGLGFIAGLLTHH